MQKQFLGLCRGMVHRLVKLISRFRMALLALLLIMERASTFLSPWYFKDKKLHIYKRVVFKRVEFLLDLGLTIISNSINSIRSLDLDLFQRSFTGDLSGTLGILLGIERGIHQVTCEHI